MHGTTTREGVSQVKLVSAVVPPSKVEEVREVLVGSSIEGLTATEVRSLGRHEESGSLNRERRRFSQLLTGLRLEIVLPDSEVESAVAVLQRVTRTDVGAGSGIYILPVEECVSIYTGERCGDAL
jgi:nitrogen regulatory protein P-II 1